nr:hypothetical protein [Tanacetum cinerariifolium]
STVIAYDPFLSIDEIEQRLLMEFLIKLSVLNRQRPLTFDFNTLCSSTGLDYKNGKYVAHPTPEVVKKELGKISINASYLDKTLVQKNSFLVAWIILFTFVIQVLDGNYSSTKQVNSIQQLLAYCLITGTEVDIREIIYSDLVTKQLRYSFISKPFKVFNIRRQQVEETYHVTFDESMEAIRFTNTSMEEIGIDDSSRYPPDEFLHEDDPSRQYQDDKGIFIYQEQYTRKLLKKYKNSDTSSVKTPMVPPNNLGPDLAGKLVNETSYKGMIGSLMYLTATRPDIQFSTVLCARYQSNPKESHLTDVKRILSGKLVCWSAKKQQLVAMSSADAEYVAAAGYCASILWMKIQLSDYDIYYKMVLDGNYSSTKQVNSIQQLLAYCIITGTEVDIREIIYSDLVTKQLMSPLPFFRKKKKVKSQTMTPTLPKSHVPEASEALPQKRKKPMSKKAPKESKATSTPKPTEGFEKSYPVSSGTVPDPQDTERNIQLAGTGLPFTSLEEGTRKSLPLPEGTLIDPKDSVGNKQPIDTGLPSTTFNKGTTKTTKKKKVKSQTMTPTLPKSHGPEASEALPQKRKKPMSKKAPKESKATSTPKPTEGSEKSYPVSSGTVPDPQDTERNIQLAGTGLPFTSLEEGTRKSLPLSEGTLIDPKDSVGNKQPGLPSTTFNKGTTKTTSRFEGPLGDKTQGETKHPLIITNQPHCC